VLALPERLRAVVVGYFYKERPMLEIAAELGVTESRVSQLRAEALILLRDGLNAHLDPDTVPPSPRLEGRVAKRRAAYHAAIGACSDFRARCWNGWLLPPETLAGQRIRSISSSRVTFRRLHRKGPPPCPLPGGMLRSHQCKKGRGG